MPVTDATAPEGKGKCADSSPVDNLLTVLLPACYKVLYLEYN